MPTAVVGGAAPHHNAANVMPTQLTAYPLAAAAQVFSHVNSQLNCDNQLVQLQKIKAQVAAAASMVQNPLTNAQVAASNQGGKLIATYPPSFHALR